ncbi:hypothetical protein CKALI_10205 [Corynebacterium kalinowskii]|uniref:Uncharacterized protein n=1 Tax=Corynebacterium kalinowskii TaxID=2675216 RepID=A0A6B8VW42_9CORY|nr:Asp23/Gls24 family envelope stress response protein [Corynebacterium kalinowskii]QGU02896.1 hypothetical protein CKALI_10205 [Corynebacterium kalinowskii]
MSLVNDILAINGVASMHRGQFGEIALLFPGSRVPGIRCSNEGVEVHVVAKRTAGDLHKLADAIRTQASSHTDAPVDVYIGDIE